MTLKVAVNGFGTIGKRVADAIVRQPDMKLVGVAKTRPSFEARRAVQRGYPLYLAASGSKAEFEKAHLPVAGLVEEMFRAADVVIDAAPDKIGKENLALYDAAKLPAVLQGGEKADVAEVSFTALANFDAALGRRRVRVVSCNTTGLARAASVLLPRWGVEEWQATLVRRAADPAETNRGPVNGILPTLRLPSHHGPDVQTIFPNLPITTAAVVVPTTLMHVHVNQVKLSRTPAGVEEVVDAFRSTRRFHLFASWERVEGTPQVLEYARDRSTGGSDFMENVLWENGIRLEGRNLTFFQAIHQESIVVPENIDALRAMFRLAKSAEESMAITDQALGIGSS